MSSSPLVVGARVRLVGLRAREELNGVEAVLLKLDGDRWAVRCVLSSERVRVKPTNLQLTPDLHERLNGSHAQQSGSLDGSSGLEKLDSSFDDSCGLERLVLQQCDGPSLRAARAVDRQLGQLAGATLDGAEWRDRIDGTHLDAWQASSPVYGFFTLRERMVSRHKLFGPMRALARNGQPPGAISRSCDGRLVAVASPAANTGVELWGANRAECVGSTRQRWRLRGARIGVPTPVHVLALSHDGCHLALASNAHSLAMHDTDIEPIEINLYSIRSRSGETRSYEIEEVTTVPGDVIVDALAWGGQTEPHLLCASRSGVIGSQPAGKLRLWRVDTGHATNADIADVTDAASVWRVACGRPVQQQEEWSFACGGLESVVLLLSPWTEPSGSRGVRTSVLLTNHRSGFAALAFDGGHRLVCAGADRSLSVWSLRTRACLAMVDYRAAIRSMPWFAELGRYERENYVAAEGAGWGGGDGEGLQDLSDDDEDEGGGGGAGDSADPQAAPLDAFARRALSRHSISALDVSGSRMAVTGDRAGCICVWDLSSAVDRGAESEEAASSSSPPPSLRLVAVLPPADDEGDGEEEATAVRGIAIVDADAEGVAGGGILFADSVGAVTKMKPVGKQDLLGLD